MNVEGLITVRSSFGHGETLARFEAAVRANGLRIVAGVDHAIAAFEAGVSLDPTTVLMVGDGACQAALMKAICRFSVACEALRSRARGGAPYHRHGRNDRRHRKKGRVAALAA